MMKALSLLIAAITLAVTHCSAKDIAWTHACHEGEDATSTHYYFYQSNGTSVERVRWVWNGGAQNAPTVTEYIRGSGKITIRQLVGTRESVGVLIAGKEAPLELKEEYSIRTEDVLPPGLPLTNKERLALANLISLLSRERTPVP